MRDLGKALLAAGIALALAGCSAQPDTGRLAGPPAPAWPEAGPGIALAPETVLTRIALGSCNREDLSQDFWPVIAATDPQLFLKIGDNIYGDRGWDGGADLASFRASYARLAAAPQFAAFRARVPMHVTWDDHDFGPNDGGGSFVYKADTEGLFEQFWNLPAEARSHAGIHHAVRYGPAGQQVQIILLDTRFFRSDLAEVPPEAREGRLGRYTPLADPAATMLGEAQWRWLEARLAEPADLRLVVSSIQVLSEAHHFESWSNLPLERARLLRLLSARAPSGLVLLSGDRHAAGLYSAPLPNGETVWEFTSSSLNAPLAHPDPGGREPDPLRRTALFGEANFGTLTIDWQARRLTMAIRSSAGPVLAEQGIGF